MVVSVANKLVLVPTGNEVLKVARNIPTDSICSPLAMMDPIGLLKRSLCTPDDNNPDSNYQQSLPASTPQMF